MNRTNIGGKVSNGVVIGRLLLLLAAGAALMVSLVVSHRQDRAASDFGERYVCPMHPQVVSSLPGDCPICNMSLERMRDGKGTEAVGSTQGAIQEVRRQVVTQTIRAPAWLGPNGLVTAIVHKESLEDLKPGDKAVFFRNDEPAKTISVRLTSAPMVPWDPATVQARFVAEVPPGADGDTGWLELGAEARTLLVVPESSVLYSGDGAYVLAAPAGGHSFTRRAIQVGRILDSGYVAEQAAERLGGIVVLSGLREGERVVTSDAFVLDAERRLRVAQGKTEDVVE